MRGSTINREPLALRVPGVNLTIRGAQRCGSVTTLTPALFAGPLPRQRSREAYRLKSLGSAQHDILRPLSQENHVGLPGPGTVAKSLL